MVRQTNADEDPRLKYEMHHEPHRKGIFWRLYHANTVWSTYSPLFLMLLAATSPFAVFAWVYHSMY